MDKNVFCTCAKARFTLIRVKTAEADERVIPERVREEAERRILIVVQVARRAFRRLSETDLKEWREAWKVDKAMIHAGHLGTKSLGDVALTPP